MAAYSDEQEAYHISLIRKILIAKGRGFIQRGKDLSVLEVMRQLEDNGVMLSRIYVTKLKNKILRERTIRVERETRELLNKQLTELLAINLEEAYNIIYSKRSSNFEKIAAMREIRETYVQIYDKKTQLADFLEDIKTIKPEANPAYQISEPKLIAVVDAMVRFNLLPKQANGNVITRDSLPKCA